MLFGVLLLGLITPIQAQVQKFFVSDAGTAKAVYRYNESVAATTSWTTDAANADPSDIAATEGAIYVLNNATKQVFRYSGSGTLPAKASATLYNNSGGALGALQGMAIDGDELWIGDLTNKRALVYSLAAAFSGGSLNATRQFTLASGNTDCQGLALDATNVYALDKTGRVFYRYLRSTANNATGTATTSRAMRNSSGNLANLMGAALEGDSIWVANAASGSDTLNRFLISDLYPTSGMGSATAVNSYTLPAANTNSTGLALNHPPAVTAITRACANNPALTSVTFNVVFSEAVTGIDAGDFTLTASGLSGAAITAVSSDAGSTRTVTVATGNGTGTLRLDFTDNDSAVDAWGLPMGGSGANANYTAGESYTIDHSGGVTCTVSGPAATCLTPLVFTITFNTNVTTLTQAGVAVSGGSIAQLTGGGAGPYTLSVAPGGQGPVTCQVLAAAVHDALNNNNTASNIATTRYDTLAPTCAVADPTSPTKANPINFSITFSEPVGGLTSAGFSVSGGTKGTVTGGGAGPYTLPVTPAGDGVVTCQVSAGAALDAAGNACAASNTVRTMVDTVAPVASVSGQTSSTYSIAFTINFSEPVTGLALASFTVGNGTARALGGTGAGPYILAVSPAAGGNVTCLVKASAVQDAAGNANAASNTASVGYTCISRFFTCDTSPSAVYRYDEAGQLETVWTPGASDSQDLCVAGDYIYIVDNSGKKAYRYNYDGGSSSSSKTLRDTAGATLGTLSGVAVDGDELWVLDASNKHLLLYSISAAFKMGMGMTVNATRQFTLASADTDGQGLCLDSTYLYVADRAGQVLYRYPRATANGTVGAATVSGVLCDKTGAALAGITGATLDGTALWVVNAGAGADAMHAFALGGLFATTGKVNAATSADMPGVNTSSTGLGVSATPRVVSITRNGNSVTNSQVVTYTVKFNKTVTGVNAGDFQVTGDAGLNGLMITAVSADSGTTRTVTIDTGAGSGELRLDLIDDDTVHDSGNLLLSGAGMNTGDFSGEVYIIDRKPPGIQIDDPWPAVSNAGCSVSYTVNYDSAASITLRPADVTLSKTGTATGDVQVSGSGNAQRTITICNVQGSGTLCISLAAGTAVDQVGNPAESVAALRAVRVSPYRNAARDWELYR